MNIFITQVPYQQPLLRQQFTPATQQLFPPYIVPVSNMAMPPTMIPDNSAMLRTAPYTPYMANPPPVIQQQQQQQHQTVMALPGKPLMQQLRQRIIRFVVY